MHTYIHTYIHTDRQTDIHTYIHRHIATYINTNTYIETCKQTPIQTFVHTRRQTYRHRNSHTYIHCTYVFRTGVLMYILFMDLTSSKIVAGRFSLPGGTISTKPTIHGRMRQVQIRGTKDSMQHATTRHSHSVAMWHVIASVRYQ